MPNTPASRAIATGIAVAERLDGLLVGARYKSTQPDECAAWLCLTIAEAFSGVLALLESPAQAHAPTLARTMVESLVNLKNLVADPDYLNQMRFDNADQQLKTFAGYRVDPSSSGEFRSNLERASAVEQQIYDQTYSVERKSFNIYKKFKRAGMLDYYETAYRFLCSFSHNNLIALQARHGHGHRLRFRQPLPPKTIIMILGVAANLYAEAIRTTSSYSTISATDAAAAADWTASQIDALGRLHGIDPPSA